jgi:hypothetical protein
VLHALLENPLGDSARLYKDAAELVALGTPGIWLTY